MTTATAQKEIINGQINFPPDADQYLLIEKSHNDWKGWVTLRFREGAHHPYVTHYYNGECGGHHWGHYFMTEGAARQDFWQRVERGY